MKSIFKISNAFFAILMVIFVTSCKEKKLDNQIEINTHIDFTINIYNGLEYQELQVVGGYMYLHGTGDSYGIIAYRSGINEFRAYDRKPFNTATYPYNRLYVDMPYVLDTCNNQAYYILNGFNANGDNSHIYWYQTIFDGSSLRIHN